MTPAEIKRFVQHHYGFVPQKIRHLPGELDENMYLSRAEGQAFVLKISHKEENQATLDMQVQALLALSDEVPELSLPQPVPTLNGHWMEQAEVKGEKRWFRLISWVDGRLWAEVKPHDAGLLESLGRCCAQLSRGLSSFDHPAAHRWIKWDLAQAAWVEPHLPELEQEAQPQLASRAWEAWDQQLRPRLPRLKRQVCHNDANDYNVLVGTASPTQLTVKGLIDFGDMVYTYRLAELAIAAAYALMHKPDPLSALLPLVKGFHQEHALEPVEMEALWPLIGLRLLTSVTAAALNRRDHPDNAYLEISEGPAWALLQRMQAIPSALAHYHIRWACGLDPCPARKTFDAWAASHHQAWGPLFQTPYDPAAIHVLDLSVGSPELGHPARYETDEGLNACVQRTLEVHGAVLGIGRYGEVRSLYTTDRYEVDGNQGPRWRTHHIGLDVFLPAGTPVCAPLPGTIHSFANNDHERDYGPTLILAHELQEGFTLYTLYGHLSLASMENWEIGRRFETGEVLGTLGAPCENGGWPPHLHLQLMLDLLGHSGDFPGVAFPEQADVMKSICPDPGQLVNLPFQALLPSPVADVDALLAKRQRLLGPNLSLSYEQPLHLLRGYGAYLYDRDGRRYLDTVNNVPHVGHQHLRVVQAAQAQLAVLNTNTRYLHQTVLDYAEALLATLPEELSVVYFVNSGSEANELALRMARAYSGKEDLLVMEQGYHGHTQACVELSSYKFDGKGGHGAPAHVHKVPIPDTFRGPHRGASPESGRAYAGYVREILEALRAQGKGVAAFFCESMLSCGGQIVLPPTYLAEVYPLVRAAGGLCVADEVQVGLGRMGDAFWGFELQGVVPDVLTLGKPLGNGHPLGAVACTPAVADAFANGMEYFNTFGGNPVSCRIGLEVLRVVQEEGMQEQAREVGNYLKARLQALQPEFPLLGEVRGHGLFLGVELVRNPETRSPHPEAGHYLINRMRQQGVLMSTDGPDHNVLKIKPPMCFGRREADGLLAQLQEVLQEDVLMG